MGNITILHDATAQSVAAAKLQSYREAKRGIADALE
jgi:hypothetical protein